MKESARMMLAALALNAGACLAGPSNLWTDNANESVVVPLSSPGLGIARAKVLIADGEQARAAKALDKVVKRWPTSSEAHRLLAQSLHTLGETERALQHEQLARSHSGGSEAISTLN